MIISVAGEMLKFLSICLSVALGVVVTVPMEMLTTTVKPEATTEDTTGRLLSLPVPEKCANSKWGSSGIHNMFGLHTKSRLNTRQFIPTSRFLKPWKLTDIWSVLATNIITFGNGPMLTFIDLCWWLQLLLMFMADDYPARSGVGSDE